MSLMPLGAGAEWPSKRLSWLFVVVVVVCFIYFFCERRSVGEVRVRCGIVTYGTRT